ncbi:MAG: hypothetical protein HWE10_00185 [Gammaproteobacteria bacterium]|nr:hypothetical protein [Gammaproteobacteria bacterium]
MCGPFVRKVESKQAVIWFVTSQKYKYQIQLQAGSLSSTESPTDIVVKSEFQSVQVGKHCFVNQFLCHIKQGFPNNTKIYYHLLKADVEFSDKPIALDLSNRTFNEDTAPNFKVTEQLSSVLQGSCRKPHHFAPDALDATTQQVNNKTIKRPDYLIMSGDQIYADDVAGPMLVAIQTLSKKLGLYSATHELGAISKQQLDWRHSMYQRSQLLPKKEQQSRWSKFWHGNDIISARYHDNHLIGLDEFFACYLLTWSFNCWQLVTDEVHQAPKQLIEKDKLLYLKELKHIEGFVGSLPNFEVLLANTATLMIFDDHDVTDDWNLTADWEEHVYGNRITKHMIRDALLSYTLFQGWGNCPEQTQDLLDEIKRVGKKRDFADNALTDVLFEHNEWHYEVETSPRIVVLDTRTHRWRSETSTKNPSGLMDWPRLEQLEQQLYKPQNSVLVVSAAPVFGVKSIEVVQSGCEMIGQELLVDVENWMAHQGSARKLMNMLRHDDAPNEVIILSGDVHYSFCFSAQRRFSSDTDKIWQLTCSGFKNEFPQGLIKFFDYIDRFLYSEHSLLNWFTKRRKMAINHHRVSVTSKLTRHLHSQSAAGYVGLNRDGYLTEYSLITGKGEKIRFDLQDD